MSNAVFDLVIFFTKRRMFIFDGSPKIFICNINRAYFWRSVEYLIQKVTNVTKFPGHRSILFISVVLNVWTHHLPHRT